MQKFNNKFRHIHTHIDKCLRICMCIHITLVMPINKAQHWQQQFRLDRERLTENRSRKMVNNLIVIKTQQQQQQQQNKTYFFFRNK